MGVFEASLNFGCCLMSKKQARENLLATGCEETDAFFERLVVFGSEIQCWKMEVQDDATKGEKFSSA